MEKDNNNIENKNININIQTTKSKYQPKDEKKEPEYVSEYPLDKLVEYLHR